MKEIRPVRERIVLLAVLLLLLAALLGAAAVRAYMLLSAALDGRRAYGETDGELSYFQLREQMFSAQADTRVSGWLSMVRSEPWAAGTQSDFRRGMEY